MVASEDMTGMKQDFFLVLFLDFFLFFRDVNKSKCFICSWFFFYDFEFKDITVVLSSFKLHTSKNFLLD